MGLVHVDPASAPQIGRGRSAATRSGVQEDRWNRFNEGPRELLEKIGFERIKSDGYAFQIEMNYRFVKNGARVKELPFFFVDRTRGTSKLNLGIAIEGLWICWWLRIADWLGRL